MLAAILVVSLFLQFFTLERIKNVLIADTSVTALSPGLSGRIGMLLDSMKIQDWMIVTILAALAAWLVVIELRGGRIGGELQSILAAEKPTMILLGLLSVTACRFYISPGLFALGDSSLHAHRAWAAAGSFSEGHFPFWSFYNYAGFPLLQFYGPLFYVIVAATSYLTGGIDPAAKFWLFLLHAGSAFPVYFWARTAGGTRGSSMLASLAYVVSFQHTHTVAWTGASPVAGIFMTFPMLLLSIDRILLCGGRSLWVPVLSISTALMILFHQGYAAYGIQIAALYIILRFIFGGRKSITIRNLAFAVTGICSGILLCSIFLWNILFGKGGVHYPQGFPLLSPGQPDLSFFKKIFLWNNMWSG